MAMTVAYTEHLSETWLLERTYHTHLWSGKELSVPNLTLAMKQLYDGTSLWQMAGHPRRIRVIDPADGHIVREIGLGEHAEQTKR